MKTVIDFFFFSQAQNVLSGVSASCSRVQLLT